MNRNDLQTLADDRVADAEALLAAKRWSGAFYLLGYAVECALKACISKQTQLHDFPDKVFAQKVFVHDLGDLLNLAGLKDQLRNDTATPHGEPLFQNWQRMKHWSEQMRYEQKTEPEASRFFEAVTHPTNGVLQWIKIHW